MAYTADIEQFRFGDDYKAAFAGKRVLITGSGKDGGIGQALALAAAANGAKVVGIHFHSSYRDGFDLVAAIRATGADAFALQADVVSLSDLWASRSYIIDQMGGKSPDIIVCNSGLSEKGYRFGRPLPEIEGESRAERRVRVRQSFMENLSESRLVMETKIDGFVSWTHMWAGEALYHERPLQLLYVSSMQAIEPGIAVPGYVLANWAVLRLPEVLRVNLGKSANLVNSSCIMFPVHPHRHDAGIRRQPQGIRPLAVAHAGDPRSGEKRRTTAVAAGDRNGPRQFPAQCQRPARRHQDQLVEGRAGGQGRAGRLELAAKLALQRSNRADTE